MTGPQDAGDNADPAGQRRQWLVRTDDAARNRDHVDRREDAERIGQRQQDDGGLEDIAKLLAGHLSFSIRTANAAISARCLVAGPRHLVRLGEATASKNRRSLARCNRMIADFGAHPYEAPHRVQRLWRTAAYAGALRRAAAKSAGGECPGAHRTTLVTQYRNPTREPPKTRRQGYVNFGTKARRCVGIPHPDIDGPKRVERA